MSRPDRGAALLAAMLVAALVAMLSATALYRQWRGVEVEAAERTRVQAAWLLTGALDWARLLLREDARAGGIDHLGEPWAMPLREARLATFLAADQGAALASHPQQDGGDGAFLSGDVTDLQSRLNVANLAQMGRVSEPALRAFTRLFELLALPPADLARLAENMRLASDAAAEGEARARAPVAPQRHGELAWLGLAPETVAALAQHVTVLPGRTAVNLNTASAEVVYSAIAGIGLADARRLVNEREHTPLRSTAEAQRLLGLTEGVTDNAAFSVGSRFFEIRARLRLDQAVVEERTLVQRDGMDVVVLQRDRGGH